MVTEIDEKTETCQDEKTWGSQTTLFSQISTQSSLEGLNTFTDMGLDSVDENVEFDENLMVLVITRLLEPDPGCTRLVEENKKMLSCPFNVLLLTIRFTPSFLSIPLTTG